MTQDTKIEWADHTINFWIGCHEVSPACDNCYARELAERYGWAKWGAKEPRYKTKGASAKAHALNRRAAKLKEQHTVFTNSLADFFDNKIPKAWRKEAWQVIGETSWLTWMILTKRPQNIIEMLPPDWQEDGYHNVWLGTTVESQLEANRRIPHLLDIPARKHFLSVEPMLTPIDLRKWIGYPVRDAMTQGEVELLKPYPRPDWVICGGESGPKRRRFDLEWAEDIKDQCATAGVSFFFKQDAHFKPGQRGRATDELWACKQIPEVA